MNLKIKRLRKDGVVTTQTVRTPAYLDAETADRKPAVRGDIERALRVWDGKVQRSGRVVRQPRTASFIGQAVADARHLNPEQNVVKQLRAIARRNRVSLELLVKHLAFDGKVVTHG